MSTRKIKHKPVLYISQPITQFPKITMQERYSTKNELSKKQVKASSETLDTEKGNLQTETEQSNEGTVNHSGEVRPEMNEVESTANPFDTKRKKQHSLQRVKHFREMNVSEKIVYLENFPKQLAPIFCLYITETTTYTGILLETFEGMIEIKLPNNTKATIKIDDLQEIRMLGFH